MTKPDRGFVLVNALIIVAAISALSVAILRDTGDSLARLAAAQTSSQSDLYLDAAAALAGKLLSEDARASETDHFGEAWALQQFRTTIDRGAAVISLNDLQGRFNLNLLLRPDPRAEIDAFIALAEVAQVGAPVISAILGHYAGSRSELVGTPSDGPRGARFSNAELAVAAELAMVAGSTNDGLEDLLPFVALLPQEALVNANTAPTEVLGALLGAVDAPLLKALDDLRREHPFADIVEFRTAVAGVFGPEVADTIPGQLLSFASEWFEVTAEVDFDGTRRAARYMLYRDPSTSAASVVARVAEDN
jgi:general secretion pathway protein K